MGQLRKFRNTDIDWDMEPVDAVVLYLEWGNTGYGGYERRVKSKNDESVYFVVNTWEDNPKVYLIRRNSDGAEELACLDMPGDLSRRYLKDVGHTKGTHPINKEVRKWLESEMN